MEQEAEVANELVFVANVAPLRILEITIDLVTKERKR